jgi:hypothetical protein
MLVSGNDKFKEFAVLFDVDIEQADTKRKLIAEDRYLRPSSLFYKRGLLTITRK